MRCYSTRAVTFLLGALVLLLGCNKEQRAALKDMLTIRDDLIAQYKAQDVSIFLMNGNALRITLVNSPFNGLQKEEQQLKAREVAARVIKLYPQIDKIESITILLVRNKRFLLIFNTNTSNGFTFQTTELKEPTAVASPNIPLQRKGTLKGGQAPKQLFRSEPFVTKVPTR